MKKTMLIRCPCCDAALEVDLEAAQAVPQGKGPDPNRDILTEGLKKIQAEKEKRKTLLETTQEELAKKKRKMQESFQEKLDQAKKEGPQKPPSPFDLD